MEVSVTCCAISLHIPHASTVAHAAAMSEPCAPACTAETSDQILRSLFFHFSFPYGTARIGGNASQSFATGREPRSNHQGRLTPCLWGELGSFAFHFLLCHTDASSQWEPRHRHLYAAFLSTGISCAFAWEKEPVTRCRSSVRHRVAHGSLGEWKREFSAFVRSIRATGTTLCESCLVAALAVAADAFPPRSLGGRRSVQGFSFVQKETTHRGGNSFLVGSGGTVQCVEDTGCTGERAQARTATTLWKRGPFQSGRAESEMTHPNTLRMGYDHLPNQARRRKGTLVLRTPRRAA